MVRIARLEIENFFTRTKWRPIFYNFAREEISSVPTFKDLDSHNKKGNNWKKTQKWKKHIDHMTLRVKSKRRQNGGAACVATVEWMKKANTSTDMYSDT